MPPLILVRRVRFLIGCVAVALSLQPASLQAQSFLIPAPTCRGIVFDHLGKNLYFATSTGNVMKYVLATRQLTTAYNLGGSLTGIDIARDDSFLLIGQKNYSGSQAMIHRVNLVTGAITNIPFPLGSSEDGGVWNVAITSNGFALMSLTGLNEAYVRQIDLKTNVVSIRYDAPGQIGRAVRAYTSISRSADGSRLYFQEADLSNGPLFTFDAVTNTFGITAKMGDFLDLYASAAVSRDGKFLATRFYNGLSIDDASNLQYLHAFAGSDGGIAFDATRDILYAVTSATAEIVAFNSTTYQSLFRIPIGEAVASGTAHFVSGDLTASQDGRYLALQTTAGIRLITVPLSPSPPPPPTGGAQRDMVYDHAGVYLYLCTENGLVERYNVALQRFDKTYLVGGNLRALDISPDDSFLLVAQGIQSTAEGMIQKLDLLTGGVTNFNYARADGESGAAHVAIAANGRALFTTEFLGSGWTPLREIDLASGSVSVRADFNQGILVGMIRNHSLLHRSADGSRICLLEADDSTGFIYTYSSSSNSFSPRVASEAFLDYASVGLSRDGSLFATNLRRNIAEIPSIESAVDFHLRGFLQEVDREVAFDPGRDVVYGVAGPKHQIIAFDAKSCAELFRITDKYLVQPSSLLSIGKLAASPNGNSIALLREDGLHLYTAQSGLPSPISQKPDLTSIKSMVFDRACRHLYLATANGFVQPYDLVTKTFAPAIRLGGVLWGMDIAPDDSYLLVAQEHSGLAEGVIHKLDLTSHTVTNINFPRGGEGGSFDIAITNNGLAFFSNRERWGYSGGGMLREIDLNTGAISSRTDMGESHVEQDTQIIRSADRSKLVFIGASSTSGPVDIYDVRTDSFYPRKRFDREMATAACALSPDGSLLGIRPGDLPAPYAAISKVPSFAASLNFPGVTSGVAFDAIQKLFYGIKSDPSRIVAFDSTTGAEKFQINTDGDLAFENSKFSPGSLVASPDGRWLVLLTSAGVKLFPTPSGAPITLPPTSPSDTYPRPTLRLANISTRGVVGSSDQVLIGGFIIKGQFPKTVALRALGPSLTNYNVTGVLPDPVLELHAAKGALLAANDDWDVGIQQSEIAAFRMTPQSFRESVIIARLPPGAYTTVVRGYNGLTGVALAEVYDMDRGSSRLTNISTRGVVNTGDQVMIGGFIVQATQTKGVVVRALGPSLSKYLPGAFGDPTLEVRTANGVLLASNDNWQSNNSQGVKVAAAGLAPPDPREAATFLYVYAGNYTVVARGTNGSTGVGLIEVYDIN